ncbi:MAG TPA: amidohydrolase family protein [Longimicrobiaceae bacterium]|nr:amidohydrolase family protein [Longimicrobiaceae bacterium]
MRSIRRRAAVLLAFALLPAAAGARAQGAAPAEPVTAFVGVTVLPMDTSRALPGQTVLVHGDSIVEVGPERGVRVPAGARVVQGRGRFLMPGLAEMHGHVPAPGAPAQYTEDVLFLYLASGITTVRGMLGAPGQLDLRARANRGEILSPTLYLAGPSFNGNSVTSPEQAAEMVRRQKAEGWDLLKVHPGLTRAEYDAMARAARAERIRFGGHVPEDVGLLRALEAGQETFDHMDGFVEYLGGDAELHPDSVAAVVRRAREAGAWIVPTMALWEVLYGVADLDSLRAFPELRYMPRNQVDAWVQAHEQRLAAPEADRAAGRRVIANRMAVLGALNRGGVRILMGTDAPQQFSVPGFSLHRELRRMAEAGMTPWEILRSGTRSVGEYFAGSDRFGMVAPGHRADLLLLDADPLRDVGNVSRIAGVMVRGRWVPRAEIDAGLERIAASR